MALICFSVATEALAQSSAEQWTYATGIVLLTIQPEGVASGSPHDTGPFGGQSPGVAGSIGRNLTDTFSIEGGIRVRGPISRDERVQVTATATFTTEHRELAFDGRVRYRPLTSRYFISPSFGIAVVRGATVHRNIVSIPINPVFPSQTVPDQTHIDHWFGIVYGANGFLWITRHVALVPAFDGYYLPNRHKPPVGAIGLAKFGFDVGVGIGVRF